MEDNTELTSTRNDGYTPLACATIIAAGNEGAGVAGMCVALGIKSRDTFYNWVKYHPEFAEAYNTARLGRQAMHEEVLLAGVLGKIKNFNFPALAMIMNNMYPDDYSRSGSSSGTSINIGSVNTIETNNKSLDQTLESLTRRLKRLGYIPPNAEDAEIEEVKDGQ